MPIRLRETADTPAATTALRRNADKRRRLEHELPGLIARGRAAGLSWESIGAALSIPGSTAWNIHHRAQKPRT